VTSLEQPNLASPQASAAIITRFHYPTAANPAKRKQFEWRFGYYRDRVLPTLAAQTGEGGQDFDVWVWCEPEHERLFQALNVNGRPVNTFRASYPPRSKGRYHVDFTTFEQTQGLPRYELQIGLDSDDMLAAPAVAQIKRQVAGARMRKLVSLQPVLLDAADGRLYRMNRRYNGRSCSAIFGMYQPRTMWTRGFYFPYHTGHVTLRRLVPDMRYLSEGLALASVHSHNETTALNTRPDRPARPFDATVGDYLSGAYWERVQGTRHEGGRRAARNVAG
jgi:hypothetical protein